MPLNVPGVVEVNTKIFVGVSPHDPARPLDERNKRLRRFQVDQRLNFWGVVARVQKLRTTQYLKIASIVRLVDDLPLLSIHIAVDVFC